MATRKDREEVLTAVEHTYRHDLPVHLYTAHLLHRIDPSWPNRRWTSWPLSDSKVPDPRTEVTYSDNVIPRDYFSTDINGQVTDVSEAATESDGTGSDTDSDTDSIWDLEDDEPEAQIRDYGLVTFKETLTNSRNDLLNEVASAIKSRVTQRALKISGGGDVGEVPDDFVMEVSKSIANKVDGLLDALLSMQQRKKAPVTLLNWQDVVLASLRVKGANAGVKVNTASVYNSCHVIFEDNTFKYEFEDGSQLAGDEAIEKYYNELTEQEKKEYDDNKVKSWYFINQKHHLIQNALRLKAHMNHISPDKGRPHKKRKQIHKEAKQMVFEHGGFRLDQDEYVVRLEH
ncbi:uncharacterized protein KQ657_004840 [Scheffersomyces spartinae]|uniref:Rrn9 domain-containing protein n=1 Tax=Scheffersomyces spartinae TaxID=45513 RepID=A0A9P8AJH2_9ASCO|nr:uncharacterized protein KQ657_004840 [Scheffersomyces spartinae]KAG7194132.1 hypothetical protein KQ657_004840 [Scheffersomyces spartinae]